MRIAFFTDTYEPQINGIVTSINLFKEQLERLGHEVYIFCPKSKKITNTKNIFQVYSFKFSPYPEYRISIPDPKILKKIEKIKPDIIHIQTPASIGLAGLSIAKYLKIPAIITYHTQISEYLQYLPWARHKMLLKINKRTIENSIRSILNISNIVIAPSNETKKYLEKIGVKRQINIIPTGIKIKTQKVKKQKNEIPIILHVGRLCKERSIDVIIKAFGKLLSKLNCKLIITSDGPDKKHLEKLVSNLNLKNNVIFTGYIDRDKLIDLYKKSDLFVTASTTDTQGIVVLEAMSYNVPSLVANAGGAKDIIIDYNNGILFSPRNIEQLSEKMLEVLKNQKLREKIIENGLKTSKEISIENCTDKLIEIYDSFKKEQISIIIPALNEEKYLSRLLESIKNQNYKNMEIIVADANSIDNTKEIAKKYKCIIVEGGKPARGRNAGALTAKNNLLLFLDADVVLPEGFLERNVIEFKRKRLDLATSNIKLLSKRSTDIIIEFVWNRWQNIMKKLDPHASGFCIFSTKELFNKLNGFDETLDFTEDHNYARRARKFKIRFDILNGRKIHVSARRLDTQGRLKLSIKYILCAIYRAVIGEPKHNLFKYKFGNHK